LEIDNFNQCSIACENIILQLDRINAVYIMLRIPNLNWNNPKVEERLGKIFEVTEESISGHLKTNHAALSQFLLEAFRKQYCT